MKPTLFDALAALIVLATLVAVTGCEAEIPSTQKSSSPCTVVHYLGPGGKVMQLRAREEPTTVAATIEREFWEVQTEPSRVQVQRNRYGEDLAGYTDEEVADALHATYFAERDHGEFVAEATQETVTKVRRSGSALVLIGGESYLPRGRTILGIEGC